MEIVYRYMVIIGLFLSRSNECKFILDENFNVILKYGDLEIEALRNCFLFVIFSVVVFIRF